MMYQFEGFEVGGFKVYKSAQKEGDTHLKRFTSPGVTPQTQATLNIYAEGAFSFGIPDTGFTQALNAGDTSLNVTLAEYPAGAVCEERVVSQTALRYCVSPLQQTPWTPLIVTLAAGEQLPTQVGDCIFIVQGSVEAGGKTHAKGTFVSHLGSAVALEDSKLVIARKR